MTYYYIKSLYVIFVLLINISEIHLDDNIIIIPLIKKDNTYLKDLKNITEIVQFIFSEPPIAELNIGTKGQKSHIIIRPDGSNIYFTSYEHNMSISDQTTKIIKNKYPNINYFNEKLSESIEFNEIQSKSYFFNNFKEWRTVSDIFENIKLNFTLATSIQFEESGALGLQLEEKTSVIQFTPSFLYQLKKQEKINNYKWFIYYGEENYKDYLVLGCSPHEFIIPDTEKKIFPNLDYDNDYYNIPDIPFTTKCQMEIEFDEVYITSNLTDLRKNETFSYKRGFLKVNIGFIIGTFDYEYYLKNDYFKDYLYNKKCHCETFKQRADYLTQDYSYIYCDDSLYKEIKESFKPLVFKKVLLNENFILSFNDLFIKKNGYLIFLVIFPDNYNIKWELGTPFLSKYQFVYDFDNKQIGYYHDRFRKEKKDDDNDDDNGNNNNNNNNSDEIYNEDNNNKFWAYFGYIFLIVILAVLLVVLGFFLGRKVYNIRKKRANELNDDDYEYKESENNIINK